MSRKLDEVMVNQQNIVRVKTATLDKQFKSFTQEANAEYVEKQPFNESDGEEFESPNKTLPADQAREKAVRRAAHMAKKLAVSRRKSEFQIEKSQKLEEKKARGAFVTVEQDSDEDDSYDSEIENQKKKRAVNIFRQNESSSDESGGSRGRKNSNDDLLNIAYPSVLEINQKGMFDMRTTQESNEGTQPTALQSERKSNSIKGLKRKATVRFHVE